MSEEETLLCSVCKRRLCDPVMLCCLHNCCRQCVNDGTGSSSQAVCKECGDVTARSALKDNPFIAGHTVFLNILAGTAGCDMCLKKGKAGQTADVLCRQCRKLLCNECLRKHNKYTDQHLTISIYEVQSSREISTTCAPLCLHHEKAVDVMCFVCETPKCIDCMKDCAVACHDIEPLSGPRTSDLVNKVTQDINDLRRSTKEFSDNIQKNFSSMVKELGSVRIKGEDFLKSNKKAIVDAVERAYSSADELLQLSCDELDLRAAELMAASKQLAKKVNHAVAYSSVLTDSDQAASLLQQQQLVLSRFRALSDELRRLQDVPPKYLNIERDLKEGFDHIIQKWIGRPCIHTGFDPNTYYANNPNASDDVASGAALLEANFASSDDPINNSSMDNHSVFEQDMASTAELWAPDSAELWAPDSAASSAFFEADCSLLSGLASTSAVSVEALASQLGSSRRPAMPLPSMRQFPVHREQRPFDFLCGSCRCVAVAGSDVRIFMRRHHPVVDSTFVDRIRIHEHWAPMEIDVTPRLRLPIIKEKKVSCKRCGQDWGVCVKINEKYFFYIKIEPFIIEADGEQQQFGGWRQLPYWLQPISESELLDYGVAEIPSDSPKPTRWYRCSSTPAQSSKEACLTAAQQSKSSDA